VILSNTERRPATAVENQLTLCTGNRRHYKSIKDLEVRIFKP